MLTQSASSYLSGLERPPIVADIMAGVGPFSCPLAVHGATVYANDLNPESYKWLCVNAKRNKVSLTSLVYSLRVWVLVVIHASAHPATIW